MTKSVTNTKTSHSIDARRKTFTVSVYSNPGTSDSYMQGVATRHARANWPTELKSGAALIVHKSHRTELAKRRCLTIVFATDPTFARVV